MATDPIVIIGMGCRLPGDIASPSELWDFLEAEKSAQSDVPASRFDIDKWYHPDPKRKGSIVSKGGYFLSHGDSYRNFDPSFFGIHPLEAASMDPQQRKLLEVVHETFESAGTTLNQVSGSQTACYVGAFTHDFNRMLSRDTEDYFPYSHTGSDMTILSNRISYVFNLKGPSLTVDTACSSSLYALHLACQSLQLGDCDAAIVGGTNMILDVQHQLLATKLGILSPTSTCHTFDESADGFGRAEGITVLYIKRLSDAIANKDPIRGVIRSTAVNTNGRGYGINHPGRLGQEAVIRRAYSKAKLPFDQTGYVECHGTGTPVGDPIEVAAIGDVFVQSRTPQTPLLLSALKSNIGHTEGASGIASVQKVVLSLEKGIIPATIGIKRVNPAIDMRGEKLKIACKAEAWPDHLQYRRASVNSFGYGGANAHIIIDAAKSYFDAIGYSLPRTWTSLTPSLVRIQHLHNGVAPNGLKDGQAHDAVISNATPVLTNGMYKTKDSNRSLKNTDRFLLVSSAHDMVTVEKNVDVLLEVVSSCDAVDIAYTLAIRRNVFRNRAITVVPEIPSQTDVVREKWTFGVGSDVSPNLAFAFTGQGAQWPKMGVDLIDNFPLVRRTFETLQTAIDTVMEPPDWTLLSALMAPPDRSLMMTDVTVTVTLCTAIQIAIVDLLDSWGIRPRAVVGHSSGEAAAAYSTGLLTASEAIITSYYRALAIVKHRVPGGMMAVGLGAAEVKKYIDGQNDLFLACHNSPESVTISGKSDAIDKLGQRLRDAGIFARKVMSSGNANHSPMVSLAAEYFVTAFRNSLPNASIMTERLAKAPMYSCITMGVVNGEDVGVEYWGRNISDPVLFNQAAQSLLTSEPSIDHIIEIGPHSALAGPIRQIKAALGYSNERLAYLPSLIRGGNGVNNMLHLAGAVFLTGYPVDIAQVNAKEGTTPLLLVDLPAYQWNYDQIPWVEGRLTREQRYRKHNRHDLLGSWEPGSSKYAPLWRNKLQVKDVPWIADHKIGNDILFPASGYIAMAVEAVAQMAMHAGTTPTKFSIQDVSIVNAIVFSGDDVVETLLNLWSTDDTSAQGQNRSFRFKISSVHGYGKWSEHASGTITYDDGPETYSDVEEINSILPATDVKREKREQDWYGIFRDVGLNYGSTFRTLKDVRCLPRNKAQAYIALHPTANTMQHESIYFVHPATLDGCLQLSFIAAQHENSGIVPRAYLPYQVKSMTIWNHQTIADEFALIEGHGNVCGLRSVNSSIDLATTDGRPLVQAEVIFLSVEAGLLARKEEAGPQPYQRLVWAPDFDHLRGSMSCSTFNSIGSQRKVNDEVEQREFLMSLRSMAWKSGQECDTLRQNGDPSSPAQDKSLLASLMSFRKLVELISFKKPGLRILEIGTGFSLISATILAGAGGGLAYPMYSSFTFTKGETEAPEALEDWLKTCKNTVGAHVDLDRDLGEQGFEEQSIDLLIVVDRSDGRRSLRSLLQRPRSLLSASGRLIIVNGKLDMGQDIANHRPDKSTTESMREKVAVESSHQSLTGAGFSGVQLDINDGEVLLAELTIKDPQWKPSSWVRASEELWFVYRDEHPLIEILEAEAIRRDNEVHRVHILELDFLPKGERVVMLVELDQPLLSRISAEELKSLRTLFERSSSIVWVVSDRDPELSLIQGMTHVIMTEYPHLQLATVSLEAGGDLTCAVDLILRHEMTLQAAGPVEHHIAQRDSIACLARYVLDEEANMDDLSQTRPVIVNGQYEPGLCLDMLHVGNVDSYFFRPTRGLQKAEHAAGGGMAVSPRLYSLNKREAMTLKGQNFDRHFSHECLGIVTSVGHDSKFAPGDHVICLKPAEFDSELLVPEELCIACADIFQDGHIVGLLIPMCTALHALLTVARVRKGEVVLVNAPDNLLNMAICEVGQQMGLHVMVVYSSDFEKEYLLQHYKIEETSLIATSTRDWRHNLAATPLGSIDVVITSSSSNGDLTKTLWSCLAPKGRLVMADANPDLSRLDSTAFSRGASISSFSLSDMLKNNLEEVAELLRNSVEYIRGGASRLPPPQQFQLNELETAVQSILSNDACNRVSLTCGPDVIVPVYRAPRSALNFRGDSSYLLVGCLGGLGRSLTMWMRDRGAREFIFLSRSADQKPEAAALVKDLRAEEITVTVVRGDVTIRKDVERAILAAKQPVRGIIQAAVVFKDSDFSAMTLDTFNAVVQPKVRGTINLHKASLKLDLDFFVMTSSTIGIIGASAQSHYAAANAFLDSMASHRWSLGLRATSLSLGMVVGVGHVHENPEIESIQRKRGIYGITEAEYLRMMELACRREDRAIDGSQYGDRSLIVTGLDPTKLAASMGTGTPERAGRNARLSHIVHAMASFTKPVSSGSDSSSNRDLTSNAQLLSLVSKDAEDTAIHAAVQSMILHKLSALVLVPVEKLMPSLSRPLSDIGLDSIIGSEFRAWAWHELRVELSIMQLLDGGRSLEWLVETIWKGISWVELQ